MKRLFKILAVFVVIIVVVLLAVMFMTSGAREVARTFVINVTSGAYEEAQASMHQALIREVPMDKMQAEFAPVAAYVDVGFSSVETSGGRTTLSGTATTADGCASQVTFTLQQDQIISFNFDPICLKQ